MHVGYGPPIHNMGFCVAGLGRAPIPENISGPAEADPGSELSRFALGSPRDRGLRLGRCVTSATPVSGRGITGGGSGYAAIWRTRNEFRTVWNLAR